MSIRSDRNEGFTLGIKEALGLTLAQISPLGAEDLEVLACADRITAEDLVARVDSPSIDASRKDGYAVIAADLADASVDNPVSLLVQGSVAAGGEAGRRISSGNTVRVLTGAGIPGGADAVLAEELVTVAGDSILVNDVTGRGDNIQPRGSDVAEGSCVVPENTHLTPGHLGFLTAAGLGEIGVFKQPRISLIATGDEVVAPGDPLPIGKLFASNMVTLGAYLDRLGMTSQMTIARDDRQSILDALTRAGNNSDAMITSGGAWTGDRDLVVKILDEMGWEMVFHHIRIGPGKAVGFGMLDDKPVFILPGGPPGNLIGFLQIALPGLQRLAGFKEPGLFQVKAKVTRDLVGRESDWTQFIFGRVERREGVYEFNSLKKLGRLQCLAEANALLAIPEGETRIRAGSTISVQLLY